MNKAEMIDRLSTELSVTKKEAKDVVEAFAKILTEGLATTGKVSLTGLGNFTKTTRQAREGRNPKTGETIQIPEKVSVKFKAASQLNDAVK